MRPHYKGPFPTKSAKDDPSYTWYRAGDYTRDYPEWPRTWQKADMERVKLDSDVVRLFEAVFRAAKRMQIDNPKRPDALLWKATFDKVLTPVAPPPVSAVVPKPIPPSPSPQLPPSVIAPPQQIITPPHPSIWRYAAPHVVRTFFLVLAFVIVTYLIATVLASSSIYQQITQNPFFFRPNPIPLATAVTSAINIRPDMPSSLEQIQFEKGHTTYTFYTELEPNIYSGYVLWILAGQQMFITGENVTNLVVLDPANSELAPLTANSGQWTFAIAKTGDHVLGISGKGIATVSIQIPPLNSLSSLVTKELSLPICTAQPGQGKLSIYLRDRPWSSFDKRNSPFAPRGTTLKILGKLKNRDGNWLKVSTLEGKLGWTHVHLCSTQYNLELIHTIPE